MLAMELWSINPLYMRIYELYFVKHMVNTKLLIPSTLIKINATKYMMMVQPLIFDSYQYLLILAWWPCTLRQQDYTEAREKRLSSIGRSQNEKMRNGAVEEQAALSHSLDVIACPCLTRTIYDFSVNLLLSHFWARKCD